MSDSAALPQFGRLPNPAGSTREFVDDRVANTPRLATALRIQLASARDFAGLRDQWSDLVARAAVPNVFMDPAVALAFVAAWSDKVRVLLAWADEVETGTQARLVGAWLLVERRTRLSWPWKALVSPPGPVAYLGTPVIDRSHLAPALAAMLEAIRKTPELPKLIQAGDMSGGSAVMTALEAVLANGAGRARLLETRSRAKLTSCDDPKAFWASSMSARRLQGFARKRRQLGKEGTLALTVVNEPGAIATAIEEFLQLEASGWKAARHSALASDPATARFTREMVSQLAERRLVSIEALRIDGVAVAMWVILFSGDAAYTWRTAYDEAYRRFSPGVLLLEHTTTRLLADPAVAFTDSCNHRDLGQQAERWPERHEVRDLLIDAGPDRPLRLLLLWGREKAFRGGKEAARRIYHRLRRELDNARRRLRGAGACEMQE
ncbi:GNAT family N-acetyltransferase [Bosea sp. (in: a-proteobacteria)]|uniref:GNAT family N-acetyltransferase n=1 Tax=Bosea sp. (in: a-proteobacteria) TaxID=1871050 RepID=UPI002FC78841